MFVANEFLVSSYFLPSLTTSLQILSKLNINEPKLSILCARSSLVSIIDAKCHYMYLQITMGVLAQAQNGDKQFWK